jgi:hypothetical protein
VEDTTSLESVEIGAQPTEQPSTAGDSLNSRKNVRQHTRKTANVSVEQARAILETAVQICQKAGLLVFASNDDGRLTLAFPGLRYVLEDDRAAFERINPQPEATETPQGAEQAPAC